MQQRLVDNHLPLSIWTKTIRAYLFSEQQQQQRISGYNEQFKFRKSQIEMTQLISEVQYHSLPGHPGSKLHSLVLVMWGGGINSEFHMTDENIHLKKSAYHSILYSCWYWRSSIWASSFRYFSSCCLILLTSVSAPSGKLSAFSSSLAWDSNSAVASLACWRSFDSFSRVLQTRN